MSGSRLPVRAAAVGLLLSLLACEPIFVIGWQEWLIMILVAALLLGPILSRFIRTWSPKDRKKKQE